MLNQMKQKGFSLLEITIAMGLMGVVSLGVMKLTQQSSKITKKLGHEESIRDVLGLTRSLILDPTVCSDTLVNQNLSTNLANPTLINNISKNAKIVISAATSSGGETTKSDFGKGSSGHIRVTSLEAFKKDDQTASLVIKIKKSPALTSKQFTRSALGAQIIQKEIIIPVEFNGATQVQDCRTDKDVIVENSVAESLEENCLAMGGVYNSSSKKCSLSSLLVGEENSVLAPNSTAINSAAIGKRNTVSGTSSMAIGFLNKIESLDSAEDVENSVAIGRRNTVRKSASVAIGDNNQSTGHRSVSIGTANEASGNDSFASGVGSKATADKTTAMGNSTASGELSTALGDSTASGKRSFAAGRGGATGEFSTAIGAATTTGKYSTTLGQGDNHGTSSLLSSQFGEIEAGAKFSYGFGENVNLGPKSSNSFAFGRLARVNAANSVLFNLAGAGSDLTKDRVFSVMWGSVGIGTMEPTATLDVRGKTKIKRNFAASDALEIEGNVKIQKGPNGTALDITGKVKASDTITAPNINASSGNFNNINSQKVTSLSDERLKEDFSPLIFPLKKLRQIKGLEYSWKSSGERSLGVIAQDIEKVLPTLVKENKDGVKSVEYNGLIALLIESVKAQDKRIRRLEKLIQKSAP